MIGLRSMLTTIDYDQLYRTLKLFILHPDLKNSMAHNSRQFWENRFLGMLLFHNIENYGESFQPDAYQLLDNLIDFHSLCHSLALSRLSHSSNSMQLL